MLLWQCCWCREHRPLWVLIAASSRCLLLWRRRMCAAAGAGATTTDPEQQAVQRYLMLGDDAVAAELGEKESATLAAYGVIAAAVPVAAMPIDQAVQHYPMTCLNVAKAPEVDARASATLDVLFFVASLGFDFPKSLAMTRPCASLTH